MSLTSGFGVFFGLSVARRVFARGVLSPSVSLVPALEEGLREEGFWFGGRCTSGFWFLTVYRGVY